MRIHLRLAFITAVACMSSSMPVPAQVYRCGNAYSHEACKGAKVVDTSPLVESVGPSSAKPATIYLCQSPGGGMFWVPRHCQQYGAWIERTETVSGHLSWENQVAAAEAQRQAALQLIAPSQRPQGSTVADPMVSRRDECDALDRRVIELDNMGRAGSRHYDLDWVRDERRKARDRQFRIRC
ncbi:hypothetical protein [Paracidovorax avenae]|uniref:hypothetical protein n=1 Tax=Paracidovorax avenae TaxID=80867 RepID=UPI00128F20B6|nr:hypothetical protein [Paracidovorax avenae]